MSIVYWGSVAICVLLLHLFLVRIYAPYDALDEVYYPQTDPIPFAVSTEDGVLYINPQNSFCFYSNFPAGDYQVEISYRLQDESLAQDGVQLHIINASQYDAAAEGYKTLNTVTLSPTQTSASFAITVEQYSHDIKMLIDDNAGDNFLIEEVHITSNTYLYNDRYVKAVFYDLCLLGFAFGLFCVYKKTQDDRKERLRKAIIYLALCGVVLMCAYPLIFNDSIFLTGHDYEFHYVRVQSIAQGLLDGQFPVRIHITANRGYGGIGSLFYPELFLYLPALLVCLNTNVHTAIVLFMIALNIAAAWFSYWAFCNISKNRLVALATTAIYLLSNYRACNYYIRFAIAEYLFMSFLPLMFYAIYHIFYEDGKRWWLLVIAATCVLQSHILGTVLTAIAFGLMIVCLLVARCIKKQPIAKPMLQLCSAGVWTVLLNIWFLFPFLTSYFSGQFAMFDETYEFYERFAATDVSIFNVFQWMPVYQPNGVNYSIGAPILLAFFAVVVMLVASLVRKKPLSACVVACAIIGGISLVLMCASDLTFWLGEHSSFFFSLFAALQFPFRFLSILIPAICFAFLLMASKMEHVKLQGVLCVALILLAGWNACIVLESDSILYYEEDPHRVVYSLYPEEYRRVDSTYWRQWAIYEVEIYYPEDEGIVVSSYEQTGTNVVLTYENPSDSAHYIEPCLFFYSGYQAIGADGTAYNLVIGDNGRLRIIIPANSSDEITISFHKRSIYLLAELMTLGMAVLFCLLVLPTKYRLRWQPLVRKILCRFAKKEKKNET